jgi:hypothetical protein
MGEELTSLLADRDLFSAGQLDHLHAKHIHELRVGGFEDVLEHAGIRTEDCSCQVEV